MGLKGQSICALWFNSECDINDEREFSTVQIDLRLLIVMYSTAR